MVSPRLEFAQTKISLKRDNMSIEIHLISNSPADNEGERSGKKNGSEYFPVYSITKTPLIKIEIIMIK